jgi:uncharacterized damage-inducible protein DinB
VFTIEGIRKFHGWTHASLDLVLDHLETIPASCYVEELPGFGFPTLRDQAIHIFNCEGFWLHVLRGQGYSDRTVKDCPAIHNVGLLQKQVSEFTEDYLSTLTDHQLNSNVELHFPDGDIAHRTPALVLHHVLTHAFHHKGQIAAMCRLLGHPLADTDLNNFA